MYVGVNSKWVKSTCGGHRDTLSHGNVDELGNELSLENNSPHAVPFNIRF